MSERRKRGVPVRNSDVRLDALLTRIRECRVGGTFWAPPPPFEPGAILRPRSARDAVEMAERALLDEPADSILALLPRARWATRARRSLVERGVAATIGDADPWAVLLPAHRLYAHVDDEYALLSHISDTVLVRADGAAAPTAAALRHALRKALFEWADYRDPFTGRAVTAEAAVTLLADWRDLFVANRRVAAAAGITWWKRPAMARFLCSGAETRVRFTRSTTGTLAAARNAGGAIAVWPSRAPPGLFEKAAATGVAVVQVEDGFIRSDGLGSDLLPPLSIVVDERGIYYDPQEPSTLEHLLQAGDFSPELLVRAEALIGAILRGGISKYGRGHPFATAQQRSGSRPLLVVGQVEDDQSVRLGGAAVCGNLDLLMRARRIEPDAELWFRPHPDVEAGHRKGAVTDAAALAYADRVVRGGAITDLLDQVDAVHVLTSLTGFEALLRGRAVTTHGQPFYAGWGLTHDLAPPITRRTRRLSLAELVAGALIQYPRYLDPVTRLPCPPEVVVRRLASHRPNKNPGLIVRARRWQGQARRALSLGFT